MKPGFLFGSLGMTVLSLWAGVFAVRGGHAGWALANGFAGGFVFAGLVYAAIYRRAARYQVRQAIREQAAESRKIFDEAYAAQLLVEGVKRDRRIDLLDEALAPERAEFKPGDPCHRCGYPWPNECECIAWNQEARDRHAAERGGST